MSTVAQEWKRLNEDLDQKFLTKVELLQMQFSLENMFGLQRTNKKSQQPGACSFGTAHFVSLISGQNVLEQ